MYNRDTGVAAYGTDDGEALTEAPLPAEADRRIGREYHDLIIAPEWLFGWKHVVMLQRTPRSSPKA